MNNFPEAQFVTKIKAELGKVVIGQEKLIDRLVIGLITGGHLLVEGVPGLAKTLTISSLSQALSASSARLQFTPDLLPADIIGTSIYNPQEHSFEVKKGPIFANIILADEINRAPAKVQSALLEAMQEKQVSIEGRTYPLPKPFLVMATQNPLEQEGTYPLPEAQMDRFMLKVEVGYLKRADEMAILKRMSHPEPDLSVNAVATCEDILKARKAVDAIFVDPQIEEYIVDLVFATRPGMETELSAQQSTAAVTKLDIASMITCGASPRATLSLTLASKALAFIYGRDHVIPSDVREIAPDVLRHRIALSYEAEAEGVDSAYVVNSILQTIQSP